MIKQWTRALVILSTLLLFTINVPALHMPGNNKNILYINSNNLGYPYTDQIVSGLSSVLDTTQGVNYYMEFMDTQRLMDSLTFVHFYENITRKYSSINFDAIIATEKSAVDFFVNYKDSLLFKDKAFIFSGIPDIDEYDFTGIDACGIIEGRELEQLFYSMHRLFPKRKNVHIFMTSSKTDSIYRNNISDFNEEFDLANYNIITDLSNDAIIQFLKTLGEEDMAFVINSNYDHTGTFKPYNNVFNHIKEPLNIPVFTDIKTRVKGFTGGKKKPGKTYGKMMAQMAIKRINNEQVKPQFIHPHVKLQYNYQELKRFNVNFSLLPRDAVIVNKPKSFFSKFKELFLVNILFILSTAAIIIILIFNNINLRKYRVNLESARDKAMQSESVKTSFIANVSHEIRTPLNAIIGFSDILMIENEDENLDEYIKHINKSSHILVRLVNDVLDLSLIDANEIKLNYNLVHLPTFMDEIIQRNLIQLDQKDKHKIRLKLKPPKEEPEELYTDQLRLNQVIQNLISNAIKYSVKGTITLSYNFVEKEEVQKLTKASNFNLAHNTYCLISVRDYGIGIPQELKNFVFERFRRLDQVYLGHHGGVGLGLNISKSIINIMGGEIWFTSTQGKGSTFSFIVPQLHTEQFTESDNDA
ncbi:HAMP domain-containing histidine kinase [Labilibacter sediminis]|nr:HAMP domain-containing histidine kinase [Labilibacter sediminis]